MGSPESDVFLKKNKFPVLRDSFDEMFRREGRRKGSRKPWHF